MKLSYLFLFLVLGTTLYADQLVFKSSSVEILVNVSDTTKKKNAEKKSVKELGTIENSNETLIEDPSTENDSLEIFIAAETMPEFVGGDTELSKFMSKNIFYPKLAKENNIEGRVIVRFVVEKDGLISNTDILRKLGFGCDEEVIRLIKSMPKWVPGKQNGKPVRVYYTLPIVFKL
jgi:protein TonB